VEEQQAMEMESASYEVRNSRSCYRVFVDGKQVAWLYYKNDWHKRGRGWRVLSLGKYSAEESRIEGREISHLTLWLETHYGDGSKWPSLKQIEEHEAAWRARKDADKVQREADAAAAAADRTRRREERAGHIATLTAIDQEPLTFRQREALRYAIAELSNR
jgi:hypothetical protein